MPWVAEAAASDPFVAYGVHCLDHSGCHRSSSEKGQYWSQSDKENPIPAYPSPLILALFHSHHICPSNGLECCVLSDHLPDHEGYRAGSQRCLLLVWGGGRGKVANWGSRSANDDGGVRAEDVEHVDGWLQRQRSHCWPPLPESPCLTQSVTGGWQGVR